MNEKTSTGIWAQGLEKRFGDNQVVQSLDLDIDEGSVYALLGPNGAGKTTTLRMLAGLIEPSAGRAVVAGVEVVHHERELSVLHRRIGLLTETPGMWDRLSARYNLIVHARLHNLADPDGAVETALRLVGLWNRRLEVVAKLSKGMRQRLAIARAILHEPPVVFLDEPTSALDPEAAADVRELIEQLRGEGRTVLLCTHNLDEAERLADQIGVFRQRLLASGSVEELRRAAFSPEVVFRFRSPDDPAAHAPSVRALPGVEDVVASNGSLTIGVQNPNDVLPRLTRALIEDGAELLFVGERVRSLEEVYLHVLEAE